MGDKEKNLQSALNKLSELSKKGIGIARDSITQSSHIVKLKLDITSLQREKKRLLSDLGEEVFAAVKEKRLKSRLFDESIANLNSIVSKIEEKNKELEATGEEAPAEEKLKEEAPKPRPKKSKAKGPAKEKTKKVKPKEDSDKKSKTPAE